VMLARAPRSKRNLCSNLARLTSGRRSRIVRPAIARLAPDRRRGSSLGSDACQRGLASKPPHSSGMATCPPATATAVSSLAATSTRATHARLGGSATEATGLTSLSVSTVAPYSSYPGNQLRPLDSECST
jgi:hypothetical protein